ncbi:MAG: hypothetical protein ABIQ64_03075 [Candidatus Saccharimonadales bacterium]
MLLLHVVIALASTLLGTYLIARPSRGALRASYTLITVTTFSGVYLMVANPSYAIRGCVAYITYLGFVTFVTHRATRALSHQNI